MSSAPPPTPSSARPAAPNAWRCWRVKTRLILLDVEMPGMDGFEFVSRARADSVLHDVPAILVTSRSSAEDRRRGAEAGARDYIVKSDFDQGRLLERIRELAG